MEKKSITNHKVFLRKSSGYRAMVDRLLIVERKYNKELAEKSTKSPLDFLAGLECTLSIASYYLAQNEIYRSIFTTSNESILKSARKYLALSIDFLAKIYSIAPDFVYDENDLRYHAHQEIEEFIGYDTVSKTGFYLDYLDQFFDVQSRWHWNVLDLSFELALIFKNSFNFKTIMQQIDIRAPRAYERKVYLAQLKNYLSEVADGFRMKYEITRMNMDMEKAVQTLDILRYLHVVLGEHREMEAQVRKIELWRNKAATDLKI